MDAQILRVFVLVALVTATASHLSVIGHRTVKGDNRTLPEIKSYHIHCNFIAYDKAETQRALDLRRRFMKKFNMEKAKPCGGMSDEGRLCVWRPHLTANKWSPFTSAQWGAFIPSQKFHDVISWMMQNRGDSSIYVHPNTEDRDLNDHRDWAFWLGGHFPLNLAIFQDKKYNAVDFYTQA